MHAAQDIEVLGQLIWSPCSKGALTVSSCASHPAAGGAARDVIHPVYLPFDRDCVRSHFAPVESKGHVDRHLKYYEENAAAAAAFKPQRQLGTPSQVATATARALQIQKDERFWGVAALLRLFHDPDRVGALTDLLSRCFGKIPPLEGLDSWPQALGTEQFLYFEVNLPSPKSYQEWLAQHLDERVLVPWLLESVREGKGTLEGATKADAVLTVPETGVAVVFEAKVLSDVSTQVRYGAVRNQIARTIDVLLDMHPKLDRSLAARRPERTCIALVTPELFRSHPTSRLYGWLMSHYKEDPALLAKHLPHRAGIDWRPVTRRLGWLTWEDFNRVRPDACPWLAYEAVDANDDAATGEPTGDATT